MESGQTIKKNLGGNKGPAVSATSRAQGLKVAPATSRAQIRRQVFAKAGHRCENCHSSYALEIDHVHPQAKGGDSFIENLRVLCRSCNQRAAIHQFGLKQMDSFLNS